MSISRDITTAPKALAEAAGYAKNHTGSPIVLADSPDHSDDILSEKRIRLLQQKIGSHTTETQQRSSEIGSYQLKPNEVLGVPRRNPGPVMRPLPDNESETVHKDMPRPSTSSMPRKGHHSR